MARALFHIAKRAWYEDQQRRWPRSEPPSDPLPGEAWFADPLALQIQLKGVSSPHHEGTSVKIDPDETDLSKAFRPRPFLIVSNEYVLDQKRAWVCPLSTAAETSASGPLPAWVVPLPEHKTFCLASKLHTIETEFFTDFADRELLRLKGSIQDASAVKIREAILQHLEGAFAPSRDPLPPGTIIRHHDGTERIVVANCYLGNLYRGAGTLTTTCRIDRGVEAPDVPAHETLPGIVLLPAPPSPADAKSTPPAPAGFVDLIDLASENQSRLLNKRVGYEPALVGAIHTAFRDLLLGESEEGQ